MAHIPDQMMEDCDTTPEAISGFVREKLEHQTELVEFNKELLKELRTFLRFVQKVEGRLTYKMGLVASEVFLTGKDINASLQNLPQLLLELEEPVRQWNKTIMDADLVQLRMSGTAAVSIMMDLMNMMLRTHLIVETLKNRKQTLYSSDDPREWWKAFRENPESIDQKLTDFPLFLEMQKTVEKANKILPNFNPEQQTIQGLQQKK